MSKLNQNCRHINDACKLATTATKRLSVETNVSSTEVAESPFDASDSYSLKSISSIHNKKFDLWGGDFLVRINPQKISGLDNVLPVLLRIFNSVFYELTTSAAGPKTYYYMTVKGKKTYRAKGQTTNRENVEVFNAEYFRLMLDEPQIFRRTLNPYKNSNKRLKECFFSTGGKKYNLRSRKGK